MRNSFVSGVTSDNWDTWNFFHFLAQSTCGCSSRVWTRMKLFLKRDFLWKLKKKLGSSSMILSSFKVSSFYGPYVARFFCFPYSQNLNKLDQISSFYLLKFFINIYRCSNSEEKGERTSFGILYKVLCKFSHRFCFLIQKKTTLSLLDRERFSNVCKNIPTKKNQV